MKIEFELHQTDLLRFAEQHINQSPTMRRMNWFFMVVPTIALFLGFVYVGRAKPLHGVLIGLFASAIYLAFGLVAGPRAVRAFIRSTLRDGPHHTGLGHHVLELSPEGLADKGEHGEMTIRWSGVGRVREDADYVYLYTQPDAALVVPKRAFAQPNEALEFVSDARRRVEQSVAPVEARG
jgi:hypothetical protein